MISNPTLWKPRLPIPRWAAGYHCTKFTHEEYTKGWKSSLRRTNSSLSIYALSLYFKAAAPQRNSSSKTQVNSRMPEALLSTNSILRQQLQTVSFYHVPKTYFSYKRSKMDPLDSQRGLGQLLKGSWSTQMPSQYWPWWEGESSMRKDSDWRMMHLWTSHLWKWP